MEKNEREKQLLRVKEEKHETKALVKRHNNLRKLIGSTCKEMREIRNSNPECSNKLEFRCKGHPSNFFPGLAIVTIVEVVL